MKIAFVFDGLQTGGIERVGSDFVNILAQKGNEITIINLDPSRVEMEKLYQGNYAIKHFRYSRLAVYQKYARLVENGLGGAIAYAGIAVILSVCNAGLKLYSRCKFHGLGKFDLVIAFSGHFNDLGFVANGFLPSNHTLAWLHGAEFEYKVISDGFFALYRKIKNLVCLSEYADITCRKFNLRNHIQKFKLYNPTFFKNKKVDTQKVEQLRKQYGRYCLMVGRMEADKDQKTAILAVKHVKDKYGIALNLLLVGDGNKRNELEHFAKEKHMNEQVHFIGTVSDVENYCASADVFVHSSPMEGLPTVLLEAMSFNLPIAATDSIPGVGEILGNNEYGLISPVFDACALGENIYKLYSSEQLRTELTERARNRLQVFMPETVECRLNEILKTIMEI